MEEKSNKSWHWLFVVPGAFIGAILGIFVLHILLLFRYLISILAPDSGTVSFESFPKSLELFLSPLFASVAFVLVGLYIAPRNKHKTAVYLACLWIVLSIVGLALAVSDQTIMGHVLTLRFKGINTILGIIGAAAIAYITIEKN